MLRLYWQRQSGRLRQYYNQPEASRVAHWRTPSPGYGNIHPEYLLRTTGLGRKKVISSTSDPENMAVFREASGNH
jgi:hypothetical protein